MGNALTQDQVDQRRIMFMEAAEDELCAAIEEHGTFASAHEGFAVLLEEVSELQAEVFLKRAERCGQRMYEECVQVAAMAAKLAIQIAEELPATSLDEIVLTPAGAAHLNQEATRGA